MLYDVLYDVIWIYMMLYAYFDTEDWNILERCKNGWTVHVRFDQEVSKKDHTSVPTSAPWLPQSWRCVMWYVKHCENIVNTRKKTCEQIVKPKPHVSRIPSIIASCDIFRCLRRGPYAALHGMSLSAGGFADQRISDRKVSLRRFWNHTKPDLTNHAEQLDIVWIQFEYNAFEHNSIILPRSFS